MKRVRYLIAVSAVAAGLITYGIATNLNAQSTTTTPPQGEQAGENGEQGNEHHPHIHHALKELREARKELKEAAHDFGGHREEALKAVDEAIAQLKTALKYDKK